MPSKSWASPLTGPSLPYRVCLRPPPTEPRVRPPAPPCLASRVLPLSRWKARPPPPAPAGPARRVLPRPPAPARPARRGPPRQAAPAGPVASGTDEGEGAIAGVVGSGRAGGGQGHGRPRGGRPRGGRPRGGRHNHEL